MKAIQSENRIGKGKAVIPVLLVVLTAAVLASFRLGRYPVSLRELAGILIGRHFGVRQFWSDTQEIAVLNIRLPRILLSVLVGACLSAAGAAYQGVFQNPMASPDVLGASAGAGFGAALAIFLGLGSGAATVLAFGMGLGTVAAVFAISRFAGEERVLGLVLAGMVVSSLFQAGTSFIKLVADPTNKLPAITYWLMGSLTGAARQEVLFALVPAVPGLAVLMLLRWQLNVLTMGDDEARTMGIRPGRIRFWAMAAATLLTAASVSVSGMIGWVGLVVPHMMRRLVGADYRLLMPCSVLGGGLFLLIVDNISRSLAGTEIPIGILTAFVGAPFFVLLLVRRGDGYGN